MSGFSDYEWERESNEAVRQPYGRPVCSALAGYESAFAKGIPDPCQPTECTNGYARLRGAGCKEGKSMPSGPGVLFNSDYPNGDVGTSGE